MELFIAAPYKPLVYHYWDEDSVLRSSDENLNGVIFQVALDENFYPMLEVLREFARMAEASGHVDMAMMALRLTIDLPISGITGFNGGHIVNTSVHGARVVQNGILQPQAPQINPAYQEPETFINPWASRLFPRISYQNFDQHVQTVHASWMRHIHVLAILACRAIWGKWRGQRALGAAADEGSCQHPDIETVADVNRESAQPLAPLLLLLNESL